MTYCSKMKTGIISNACADLCTTVYYHTQPANDPIPKTRFDIFGGVQTGIASTVSMTAVVNSYFFLALSGAHAFSQIWDC